MKTPLPLLLALVGCGSGFEAAPLVEPAPAVDAATRDDAATSDAETRHDAAVDAPVADAAPAGDVVAVKETSLPETAPTCDPISSFSNICGMQGFLPPEYFCSNNTPTPTPAECQCRETYNCSCLEASGVPLCASGKTFVQCVDEDAVLPEVTCR
jgi:hypothetical protein